MYMPRWPANRYSFWVTYLTSIYCASELFFVIQTITDWLICVMSYFGEGAQIKLT